LFPELGSGGGIGGLFPTTPIPQPTPQPPIPQPIPRPPFPGG
jgi:hypothetical protein